MKRRKKSSAATKLAWNTKVYREFNNKMKLEIARMKKKLK